MKYCRSCILPDTRPNLVLDADGICNGCRSHATKPSIDWEARRRDFTKVVANAKQRSSGYDCLIPVSGGKDSTWQVVVCLEHGLRPLCVTWKSPGRTGIGRENLENLVRLGVDHIDFQVNPEVEKRFMVASLETYGSTAIPMHMGIFNIPLKLAVKFNIPLVIWGENSAFEYGSTEDALTGFTLDEAWLKKYGVTHGTSAADWVGKGFTKAELTSYFGPTEEELARYRPLAIFLGYYLEWDPSTTYKVAREHGFRANVGGARTGYYDYADIDDDFISLHHWLKWYKFGFTRTWDNLSLEIRNGRITRDAAIAHLRTRGDETPSTDIDTFCRFAGIERSRWDALCERWRNTSTVWQRRDDGAWQIPDFLIPDWEWS